MDPVATIVSRRSVSALTAPAPTDEELLVLVEQAMTAPDHGLLRPWRLLVIRDEARHVLAASIARSLPDPDEGARAGAKALRSPLLVGIVYTPDPAARVPEWEQLAATSAMVHNLGLILHARGWASVWKTGRLVEADPVRAAMGAGPGERVLGWVHVGTADPAKRPAPRKPADARAHVARLHEDGSIAPLRELEGALR
ncbi:Nitroreductase family protein [Alloactinosynnema sp. L-07]|uniref:nitroreductase family protein n=1 Tax=Alloactinosynnema sp. L-07 TaxID=1653480 RepID=UPI00065F0B96|nr:nitroreductase [Alloactinosynnema sp. L-07]CRK57286.1 Nitroreductase family protein [Alloactinosynnema sp. L-07]